MARFEVDEDNFQEVMDEEFSKDKIVVLKFGSGFCEACSALDMELEQLEDMSKNVSILSVDCDQCPDLAQAYNVYTLPTMIIFKNNNNILHEADGVVLADDIKKIIDSSL